MLKRAFAGVSVILALALTGCSSPKENNSNNSQSQTTVVRSGYLAVLGAGDVPKVSNEIAPKKGTVLIPDGSLKVLNVSVSEQIDSASNIVLTPAKGEQFYVVQLDVQYGSPHRKPELTVSIDKSPSPLELQEFSKQTVVVSASKDSKVTLDVGFQGVTQTVDLATGERTSEDIPSLYLGAASAKAIESVNAVKPGVYGNVTLEGTVRKATRVAWDSNLGWADNGKSVWVVLDAPITWKYESSSRGVKAENIDAQWFITDETGAEYPVVGEIGKLPVIKIPATSLALKTFVRGTGQTYDGNQPESVVSAQTSPLELTF